MHNQTNSNIEFFDNNINKLNNIEQKKHVMGY